MFSLGSLQNLLRLFAYSTHDIHIYGNQLPLLSFNWLALGCEKTVAMKTQLQGKVNNMVGWWSSYAWQFLGGSKVAPVVRLPFLTICDHLPPTLNKQNQLNKSKQITGQNHPWFIWLIADQINNYTKPTKTYWECKLPLCLCLPFSPGSLLKKP